MDEALAIILAGVPDRDDAELARAATEDRAAFAAIYERHRTPVYRYLRARTATDADAEDLAATTFERAMGAIHRFQPVGGGMVASLIRIARNAHSDALRQQRRRGIEVAAETAEPAIDPSDDAVVLRSLIDGLPSGQRDAIQLRFAAGLTAREIGGVLGISEAAAQKQVERGLHARRRPTVSTDTPFEQRLRTLYAVSVPTELDRRIDTAMTTVPMPRSGRIRPQMLAALAVRVVRVVRRMARSLRSSGTSGSPRLRADGRVGAGGLRDRERTGHPPDVQGPRDSVMAEPGALDD